jgi:hypothetical protein
MSATKEDCIPPICGPPLSVDHAVTDDAGVGAAHPDQRGCRTLDGRIAGPEQGDAGVDLSAAERKVCLRRRQGSRASFWSCTR